MLIDWSLFGDECIYVGDANQNLYVSVGQALDDFDLIEIAGGVIVDRRPEQASEVADVFSGRD